MRRETIRRALLAIRARYRSDDPLAALVGTLGKSCVEGGTALVVASVCVGVVAAVSWGLAGGEGPRWLDTVGATVVLAGLLEQRLRCSVIRPAT